MEGEDPESEAGQAVNRKLLPLSGTGHEGKGAHQLLSGPAHTTFLPAAASLGVCIRRSASSFL